VTTGDLSVPIDGGSTTAIHYPADGSTRGDTVVLAHGAGAGQRHPFMVAIARGLQERGFEVVTFDFPYVTQKRKVPDRAPVLEACFERVIDQARALASSNRIIVAGKSMGGRMATHLMARGVEGLAGVVALGYPLHPPGRPDQLRDEHLPRIAAPVLIVQGERDTFGTPGELAPVIKRMKAAVTLHVIAGGDHSFKVPKRKPAEVYEEVLSTIDAWAPFTPCT
jgi:uncharacterized protein